MACSKTFIRSYQCRNDRPIRGTKERKQNGNRTAAATDVRRSFGQFTPTFQVNPKDEMKAITKDTVVAAARQLDELPARQRDCCLHEALMQLKPQLKGLRSRGYTQTQIAQKVSVALDCNVSVKALARVISEPRTKPKRCRRSAEASNADVSA